VYVPPVKYGAPLKERDVAVNATTTVLPVVIVGFNGTLVEIVLNGAQKNCALLEEIGVYGLDPLDIEIEDEM
jgi:hypothetical protein